MGFGAILGAIFGAIFLVLNWAPDRSFLVLPENSSPPAAAAAAAAAALLSRVKMGSL